MATSAPKFRNPWADAEGFIDLGPYEFDGVHHDLYCFASIPGILIHVGARYGEFSAYNSASIEQSYRGGKSYLVCRGYNGALKEAVSRMIKRRIVTDMLYDASQKLIYSPSALSPFATDIYQPPYYRQSLC